jgi:hypothetical protein
MKRTIAVLLTSVLTVISMPLSEASGSKNPYGTATIDPAAPNEIILTISKGSKRVSFAYPRLAKMKQSRINIYEPFLKKRQTFTVIRLQLLFNLAGISGEDRVVTTALNDYIFTSSAKNFIAAGAYLAIKRNGAPIGYDQGGPIRIVYGDTSKWAKNLDAWNWSIESFSVK